MPPTDSRPFFHQSVSQVKERTRGEQGEEKKLTRMLVDMEDMFGAMGKTLGEDILRLEFATL